MTPRLECEDLVSQLYLTLLGRNVEPDELVGRVAEMQEGLPAAELFRRIYGSFEAEARRTAALPKSESNSDFVHSIEDVREFVVSAYEATLSRSPTAEEVENCLLVLNGGLKAAYFIRGLNESEEARNMRSHQQQMLVNDSLFICISSIQKTLGFKNTDFGMNQGNSLSGVLSDGLDAWLRTDSGQKLIEDFRKASVAQLVQRKELAWVDGDQLEKVRERLVTSMYLGVFGRIIQSNELTQWVGHLNLGLSLDEFVQILVSSEEGQAFRSMAGVCRSIEHLIQQVGLMIAGEAYTAADISDRVDRMRRAGHTPVRYLVEQFSEVYRKSQRTEASGETLDILGNLYMVGSNKPFAIRHWFDEERHATAPRQRMKSNRPKREKRGSVTAIASIYNGGRYIEAFMQNMLEQTIFSEDVTLVIIDAASPQNEAEIIRRYTKDNKNIVYFRAEERIGIYDAWNKAIQMSSSDYITNVNLDDLRREDSLEIQRDMLDQLDFADVVYQDFLFTLDSNTSFQEIQRRNLRCRLPHITLTNLVHFNSPHNGPMWRRQLHVDLGYFKSEYRSAGDCDFWIRCCEAGKVFVKSNEAHVAYYVNPHGLSTNAETRGFSEHAEIKRDFGIKLVDESFYEEKEAFAARIGAPAETVDDRSRYDVVTERLLSLSQDA